MSAEKHGKEYAGERWHLALAAGFGACCLAGMVTTAFRAFSASASLGLGLACALLCWFRPWGTGGGTRWPRPMTLAGIAVVLAISGWLRLPAALNTIGGFDPALYCVMGMNIAQTGDLEATDAMHASLSPELRALYEKNLAAGIAWTDREHSRYITPYYPLTSVWMSLFIRLGGPDAAVWSLTISGLLAVLGLGMLAREMAGGRDLAGWLAALLAAVHPGLVHFSRFPLSEGIALALTTHAAALLLRAWRRADAGQAHGAELAVSAVLFAGFFFARMTGLFYVPFVVAAVMIALPARAAGTRARWVAFLVAFVAAWIGASAFYAVRMQPLFGPIMRFMLAPLEKHLALVAIAGCIGLATMTWLYFRRTAWVTAGGRWLAGAAPWALSVVLLLTCWTIYAGWRAGGLPVTSEYPFQAMRGHDLLTHTLPYRLLLYLTPGLLLPLLLGPLWRAFPPLGALRVMMWFMTYMVLLTLASPYGFLRGLSFYMDRYYLTELVPCGLAIAAVWCASQATAPRWRQVSGTALALAVAGWLGWTAAPQRAIPIGDAGDFIAAVEQVARPDDLILFVTDRVAPHSPNRHMLHTPLAYWAGLRVFAIDRDDLALPAVQKLAAAAPHAYVLAAEVLGNRASESGMRLERGIRYDLAAPFTPAEMARIRGATAKNGQEWMDYPMIKGRTRGQMQLHLWTPAGATPATGAATP